MYVFLQYTDEPEIECNLLGVLFAFSSFSHNYFFFKAENNL